MGKKVYIGSDHGVAFKLKQELIPYLEEKGFEVLDQGTTSDERVDYPDYIFPVAEGVVNDPDSVGIAICASGLGASMCANKVKGIRAALCEREDEAEMSRRHNDANVLVFGAKYIAADQAKALFDIWISTEFDGGRHEGRVEKITKYEQ